MLTTESIPVAFPVAVGPKFTETVTDWYGARVTLDPPLSVNPFPEAATEEITRLALPVLVKVTSWAVEVPVATLPKLMAVLLAASCAVWLLDDDVDAPDVDVVVSEVPDADVVVLVGDVVDFDDAPEVSGDLVVVPTHPTLPNIEMNATAPNKIFWKLCRWELLYEFVMVIRIVWPHHCNRLLTVGTYVGQVSIRPQKRAVGMKR